MLEAFGGQMGDLLANMESASKIQQNERVVRHCESLVGQQEAMVRALLGALAQDGAAAVQAQAQAQAQLAQEKQRRFEELRLQFTGSTLVAQPAAVAQAVAQPAVAQAVAQPAVAQALAQPAVAQVVAQPAAFAQEAEYLKPDITQGYAQPAVATAIPVGF